MQRGYTLPLTAVEFWILCAMVVIGGLVLWSLHAIRIGDRGDGRSRSDSERLLEILAWLLSPVWAALILFVVYLMWKLGSRLTETMPGQDLRWYALGFVGLVTSLLALVSAPLALIRVATTERQTRTAEQGHMTDRISKAVEQLGAEKTVKKIVTGDDGKPTTQETTETNLEVRIGGLLSLERIAQDSTAYDKGRDHVRVMEIICAYIRNNAPGHEAKNFPLAEWISLPEGATEMQHREYQVYDAIRFGGPGEKGDYYEGNLDEWLRTLPPPKVDILLALRILDRRSLEQRKIEAAHGQPKVGGLRWAFEKPTISPPDKSLRDIQLRNASLSFRAELSAWQKTLTLYRGYRLDLQNVNLQGYPVAGLRLQGADFSKSRLEGAKFDGASLEGANFLAAHLDGASFLSGNLSGANFFAATAHRVNFNQTEAMSVEFNGCQLHRAAFSQANLCGARIAIADLTGADLSFSDMVDVFISATSTQATNFSNVRGSLGVFVGLRTDGQADFTEAVLDWAALHRLDLFDEEMLPMSIGSCFGDGSVILPSSTERPNHWPSAQLDFFEFNEHWRNWLTNPSTYTPPPPTASP